MKCSFLTVFFFVQSAILFSQSNKQKIITLDIDNFWIAYDKITQTKDTTAQYNYLNELYINKGTKGLQSLMEVRRYTPKQYIDAINAYPKFWNSIRANTFKAKELKTVIEADIEKLRKIYPTLKPSTIYFAIGVFRTNGTIRGKNILIGSEMALSGKNIDVSELPAHPQEFNKQYNPIEEIGLLCTHEYIHTQQSLPVDNLLCNSLYEGVAEFISCYATQKPSTTPSFKFARANEELVKRRFIEDMFVPERMYNWIWGANNNELIERDLGYYIGYRICEEYLKHAINKESAIKYMIELDYSNEILVEKFVDNSMYFSNSVSYLYSEFDKSRPYVVSITQFVNGSKDLSAAINVITINFSAPMNIDARGFDYGPLGEKSVLMVQKVIGFSADKKSFSYEVKLAPGKHYQSLVTNRFTSESGIPLKPFLIDITTAE